MTTTAALDERYGRTRMTKRRRRGWIVVAATAIAVAIAIMGWVAVQGQRYTVSSDVLGFNADNAGYVTVDFQFAASPGDGVTCALAAKDTQHGVVGYRVVHYPAGDSHQKRVQERIRTVALATTGTVEGCWVS